MKILLAPDKFKGTLTAEEVCAIMQRGLHSVLPDADIVSCPIADGGDGFAEVLRSQLNGAWVECPAHDALGRPIDARYALCGDTAVIEMSEASGLWRVAENVRDIWRSSTLGTGEMMRHAIEQSRVKRIIMGIGGSATNDAGCGMAAALGVRFLNDRGDELDPTPSELKHCGKIDISERLTLPEVLIACDVDNPLLGNEGATRVYGPQKGVVENDFGQWDDYFELLVTLTDGGTAAMIPGAGAAGGLGFGLIQFCGARLLPGFDLVAQEVGLMEKILACDVVITGEGRLDAQTLHGKGPAGVAEMARDAGKKVFAIAGSVECEPLHLFDGAYALHHDSRTLEESMQRSEELLMVAAVELGDTLRASGRV
ncbi:glycerate kinase [Oceaniferula spumae]|uniref:Glycerate kinase n=1 Tax=Oceaniferula spumae TaxID=2979115 RepID=A0AAT9FQR3_9BACT